MTTHTFCQVILHCLITAGHTQAGMTSLTWLFELAAWLWKYTDKWLPTMMFYVLIHDSEAANCQLSDSVVAPIKGRRGVQLILSCMQWILTNDYKIQNRVFHSDDDPVDCCIPPPPNSFWFYSWTRLDYRESLDLLVPGSHEDDNRELRVVSAPAASCLQILVSRFPFPFPFLSRFAFPAFQNSCPSNDTHWVAANSVATTCAGVVLGKRIIHFDCATALL